MEREFGSPILLVIAIALLLLLLPAVLPEEGEADVTPETTVEEGVHATPSCSYKIFAIIIKK